MAIHLKTTASSSDTHCVPLDSSSLQIDTDTLSKRAEGHTISKLFLKTVADHGDKTAIRKIVKTTGDGSSKEYNKNYSVISYSWSQYAEKAKAFAKALIANKIQAQDVVTIQGSNSPEWMFANLGTILAGGVTAGLYNTNVKSLCEHAVKTSQAKIAIVENEEQLKKYEGLQSSTLKCIVVWEKFKKPENFSIPVLSMEEFLQTGKKVSTRSLQGRIKKQNPTDPCTLIYTSGTTGNPKAAVLTHENLTWTGHLAGEKFGINSSDRAISFLPLNHVAAQQLDFVIPLIFGQSVDITPPDAIKGSNLKQHLVNTKPTYLVAVPRLWEKFKEGIEARLKTAPFFKRTLFYISSSIGKALVPDYNYLVEKKHTGKLFLYEKIRLVFERTILSLFEKIIFKPIKAALGLDQCRIVASGAGVLEPKVRQFFDGINLHLLNIYGASETSGPTALPSRATPVGSCGIAHPGVEIKIKKEDENDENDEGEILIKGKNIFKGYLGDEEATREALDAEGFLHTGDNGKIDQNGNIFITGRIKELIKTSGGENIPPLNIEEKIKAELQIVSQAIVIGNGKNFLTCLLTLKTEVDADGNPTDQLTSEVLDTLRTIKSTATTLQEAAKDEKIKQFLMQGIKRANEQADSHAQYIQKISLLPEDLSVTNGMLTPTLKLRRGVIEKAYAEQIDSMYAA